MQPFPHPSDATHKIWSRLANWLQRYSSLKVWTTTDDDDGPLVYYKLTLWAFGSGELKKMPEILWFCQRFSHESQKAGKAIKKPVISGLNPEIWQAWNIDITKATGADNFWPRLLILAAPYISESLTFICNQSIINNIFPEKWKEGKVTPLHKNEPKDHTNNYRPISLLPVVSKLLEKHVHDSLMAYLSSNSLLHSTFRFLA